ncbi:transglutaminase family protein [Lunatimonas lonarensis]|uniref:transglutaminase family protein n=1 Tax=Lunatimonas lonarensis TaxID=1232681 RepID=UPI0005690F4B|nr:transglutaminase family protein [Lunatimonas lonarensis]
MKIRIHHETLYTYSSKVFLNPHQLLLKPLQRDYLRILEYRLDVAPEPSGISERFSLEGNPYFQVWFGESSAELRVMLHAHVESRPFNPYAFVIDSGFLESVDVAREKPFTYHSEETPLLAPFLAGGEHSELTSFVRDHMTSGDPILFLTSLNASLYAEWEHMIRLEENVWEPVYTFHKKQASCRDLAWMMMIMLRNAGIASRFVSGYAFNPDLDEGHELHAWVEAYLPGAGWIGLDPSLGLLADHHYIPLATGHHPSRTLPVHGTVGGDRIVKATLSSRVELMQTDINQG